MTEIQMRKGDAVPQTFKVWFLNDRDHTEKWREEAKEDYDFVAGRQWTDDEIEKLKAKARPVITFNRIQPVIDSVQGHEIGNRREVRFIPREMGDVKANELLTSAAWWFRDLSHAEDHESDSFLDTIVCGMGWTETRIDFEENAAGLPVVQRVDPLEMYWDFDAKDRNLADARRVWRVRRVPLSEAMAMFPDRSRYELDASWTTVRDIGDLKRQSEGNTGAEDDKSGDGMVTVVHIQWIERESYYIAYDPVSGQEAEFTVAEYETANKRMKQLIGTEMQGVKRRRKVRKQAFIGEVVLSVGPAPCDKLFSFQCITGKRDRNKGTWYGLVRGMKDPQKWANKWLSQMLHIMNANSKGGLLAERGAFENQVEAEETWADPSAITFVENGAIRDSRIKEKAPPQFPAGFQQLTEFAVSSIRDVTGVSVEMLGMREANQAASLEYQRRQAGLTILQPWFDSLRHYRELQGRVMLDYIQNDLSDGRLIRVVGKDKEQYLPLVKQADVDYDIIVDDAPTSPNQKEAAWQMMTQLLPMLGKAAPPQIILKALEYSPLPSKVVEEMQEIAKQAEQSNAQAQQMQAAGAAMQMQADIRDRNAKAEASVAKAQVEQAKVPLEMRKTQIAEAELENDFREMQIEASHAQTNRMKAFADIAHGQRELDIREFEAVAKTAAAREAAKAKARPSQQDPRA